MDGLIALVYARKLYDLAEGPQGPPGQDGEVTNAALEEKLEAYAKVDGSYENLTVGNAEQLVSNVRVNDKTPYLFRTSGGSVDIGDREYINGIVGGTVAFNQLVKALSSTDWHTESGVNASYSDGVATITNTSSSNNGIYSGATLVSGHKYFLSCELNAQDANTYTIGRGSVGVYTSIMLSANSGFKQVSAIKACTVSGEAAMLIYGTGSYSNLKAKNFMAIDLTQMFGSTIADYIYSLETATAGAGVAWFKKLFNKPYYAYDAGTLKHVEGLVSHDMTGFNQLGGSFVSGKKWNSGTYEDGSTNQAANSFKAKCLPNTQYCFCMPQITSNIGYYRTYFDADGTFITKTSADGINSTAKTGLFTTPSNAYYVAIDLYKPGGFTATELEKACLNISWDGSRDGEYEPYVKHSYPLDSDLTLRGIPKLDANNNLYYDGDVYEADGTVNRKYGIVDLGTLDWYRVQSAGIYVLYAELPSGSKADDFNGICSKYPVGDSITYLVANDKAARCYGSALYNFSRIGVRDDAYTDATAFKSVMSGVYLVYELATPTTESADPYQQTEIVSDFGTEEFVIDDDVFAIPVGHNTDYPIDLKAKLEMAPNSPSGDGMYVVKQTNGTNEYVPLIIPSGIPAVPSENGSYTLTATVADGTTTLSWS